MSAGTLWKGLCKQTLSEEKEKKVQSSLGIKERESTADSTNTDGKAKVQEKC